MKSIVPLSRPSIAKSDVDLVAKVLRSGWLTMGPKVIEFENRLSHFFGTRPVLCVSSATAALHLSLIPDGFIFHVVGSISTNTGRAPTIKITFAVAANVM